MSLLERVRLTIREHALACAETRVVVAVSGGPDSVALAHLLIALQGTGDLVVVGLAHFNHLLRGAEAHADEAFCLTLAETLGLPIQVGREDVAAAAGASGRSTEDIARELRYKFLNDAADRMRADAIAIGHSLDDQAETFLLRLIRGAGTRGLGSIRPRVGRVIRPLLDVPRADLRQYLAAHALPFCTDATNGDLSIPRNRVRHELIPYLQREFSPGISRVLAREAAIAREDADRLHHEAIDLSRSIVLTVTGEQTELDALALRALPQALATRVAHDALTRHAGDRFIGFDHVARLLRLADGPEGEAVDFPGQRAVCRGGRIVLGRAARRQREAGAQSSFRFSLSIPGEVTLDSQGWAVSAERLDSVHDGRRQRARGREVFVAAEPLAMPLAVRSRRRGDRFAPLGLGHRKKLQDFLVDRKIPREMRDSLPLVVDGQDRIVWVVGQSVAEDFRVTEPSRGVILLKARRLGGLG